MPEKLQIIILVEIKSFTKEFQLLTTLPRMVSTGNLGVLGDQNTPNRSRSCTHCVQIPLFSLKQKHEESTQASDVTHASESITGILLRPRFHQVWQEWTAGHIPCQPEQTVVPPEVLADSNELDGLHTEWGLVFYNPSGSVDSACQTYLWTLFHSCSFNYVFGG